MISPSSDAKSVASSAHPAKKLSFSGLRVGLVPLNRSRLHPFDLKNFVFYARKRDIQFEIAKPDAEYDVVVLSPLADISAWSRYPRGRTKLIFMCVDSYLGEAGFNIKSNFRGLAKYLSGEHKYLQLSYSGALRDMCRRADAVICSTLEQKNDILQCCDNVHVILESHFALVREVKTDYSIGNVVNIVWEGRPENVDGLAQIREVLRNLRKQHPITLHVLTDLAYNKYMNKIGETSIVKKIQRVFGEDYHANTVAGNDSLVYLYQWNPQMFSRVVTRCDIAVIPLDPGDYLMHGKPENKLLLFWRMGMPTIVSSTPAYTRAMNKCGLQLYCKDNAVWKEKLEGLIVDHDARRNAGISGKQCADGIYGESQYLDQWDHLFQSVLQ